MPSKASLGLTFGLAAATLLTVGADAAFFYPLPLIVRTAAIKPSLKPSPADAVRPVKSMLDVMAVQGTWGEPPDRGSQAFSSLTPDTLEKLIKLSSMIAATDTLQKTLSVKDLKVGNTFSVPVVEGNDPAQSILAEITIVDSKGKVHDNFNGAALAGGVQHRCVTATVSPVLPTNVSFSLTQTEIDSQVVTCIDATIQRLRPNDNAMGSKPVEKKVPIPPKKDF